MPSMASNASQVPINIFSLVIGKESIILQYVRIILETVMPVRGTVSFLVGNLLLV